MELSISNKLFRNIKNNRWQHEFSEREKIGAGGFASVYKAKNCYDDQVYAVKKVKLQFKDIRKNFEQELQKVLDEAKFIAKFKHENILRYYGSWLEATTRPNKPAIKNLTLKPSLFRRQKENVNTLNLELDLDGNNCEVHHEDNSPLVVFGEVDRAEDDSEETIKPSFKKEEEKVVKKENGFPRRLSRFCNNRLSGERELKIMPKLRITTSQPDECSTPLVRGEKLENIMLFIQTELCSNTLESYIDLRNTVLQEIKKQSPEDYQKKRNEYLREALVFAKQILNGLAHIHSHQVVHRDLKPSNIFIAGKVCKIGDFGLVKQLVSFFPVEDSPSLQETEKVVNPRVDCFQPSKPNRYDKLCLMTKKSSSDPSYVLKAETSPENVDHITKSIGTRLYASPEQWMADKDNFDYRADIFSLGVCFLLLFHPMSTYMERNTIISDSKEGNIPEALEKELPEIAEIIKKMLSLDPASRPSIEKIIQSLKLPNEIKSQLCGKMNFRKENALRWRKKYFKIIDGHLYLYSKENEVKAENIYNLSHWIITLEEESKGAKHSRDSSLPESQCQGGSLISRSKSMYIKLENPEQLGCEFKATDCNNIVELFKAFEDYKRGF